jgi:DNA-binding CsgD family transcriptional regulator
MHWLPVPQRSALEVAFGLKEGDPPNALLVGLAVLTLLAAGSTERPIICVVDDAQWIDSASLQTLAFVARRLLAEPVGMIFAARDRAAEHELDGLPELTLGALRDPDARSLLAATLPGRLEAHMRENILAEAGGNPLALMELPRALTPVELAGGYGYGLVSSKLVTARIEQTFGQRLRKLPSQTQTLLLIAAAEPTGEPQWLWKAAERLGIEANAATPAEAAGLIQFDGRIRFRHPLVRSAVYRSAPLAQRRRIHQALAKAITGSAAEDHRAWHHAHSASAPDEQVAAELERSAERARARGGVAAAAAFLAFAVELTPDHTIRAGRALDAAQAKLDAGDPEMAARLLMIAEDGAHDPLLFARSELQRAKLAFAVSRGSDAPPLLLAAAKRLAELDRLLSRETYLEALMSSIIVGRLYGDEHNSAAAIARAAQEAPPPPHPPRAVDLLLDGLVVRLTEGYVAAAPLLRNAIDQFVCEEALGKADPRWHDITNRVLLDLFDPDTYDSLTARQVDTLRAGGALALLPVALTTRAGMCATRGEFSDASALLEEAEVITTAIGAPAQRYIEPFLAASRGQEQLTLEFVQASIEGATRRGEGFAISVALYSAAILHNGLCHYSEALAACESALEHDDLGMAGYVLVEMVEAATRCGATSTAATALERLIERTDELHTDSALGLAARSKALLTDGAAAEAEFLKAIGYLECSPLGFHLPRAHLVYGEWLRRTGRRVDAREQLGIAYQLFTAMHAEGYAERTRREIGATGEIIRKRSPGSKIELTTQERYILRLARDGHTNAEIAAQLFISSRTVEWHLSKIFVKLGVTSRRDLKRVTDERL